MDFNILVFWYTFILISVGYISRSAFLDHRFSRCSVLLKTTNSFQNWFCQSVFLPVLYECSECSKSFSKFGIDFRLDFFQKIRLDFFFLFNCNHCVVSCYLTLVLIFISLRGDDVYTFFICLLHFKVLFCKIFCVSCPILLHYFYFFDS